MKKISMIFILILIGGIIVFFQFNSEEDGHTYTVAEGKLSQVSVETSELYDIKDVVKTFQVTKSDKVIGEAKVTERHFPNGDSILFVDFHSPKQDNIFSVKVGKGSAIIKEKSIATPVTKLYPFRKNRKNTDPLSTRLNYIETNEMSFLFGSQVMYKNISHTYKTSNEKSKVLQFLEESHEYEMKTDGMYFPLRASQSKVSTWIMISNEHLFKNDQELAKAHRIGVDEFRWISPNSTFSHGLGSIYPSHPDAFVRSLVRQSGRSSSIALEKEPTRFYENINRHLFKSLEDSRDKDGLWHSNYTSTWLEKAYGFGPDYVDSRHNDNIFRSQIRRAEILGYTDYESNIEVYADFLLDMVKQNYTIETEHGYYLVDYYDLNNQSLTHTSLNHALSLMNYLYYAYIKTGNADYLKTADSQLAALIDTGTGWISDDGQVNYQLKLDGTFSGKDYNLVTYYDLLYTKKLLSLLEKPEVPIIIKLIETKKINLLERNIKFEEDEKIIEDFVGLIE